jgi:CRP-like cAMP-binding protein
MDGLLGQVEELTWRALVLRTRTGQRVLVPNNQVARSSLRVWPLGEPGAVTVHWGTEYGASPAQVKAILQRVAESIPEVLAKPAPQFLLASFGDSALSWECRLWTLSPEKQGDLTDAPLTRAWAALRRQGVEIPFPQRVLHRAQPPREKPSSEAVRAAFLACPTFASLPPPLLEALAAHSRLVTFADGEPSLKEGEASRALYVVSSGMARVVKARQEVARLGPGELFGEMAFLTGQPRVASVLALGELRAVEVDEEALRHALRQQPALAEELAQRVADLSSALQRQQELLAVETPQALKSSLLTRLLRFMGAGP